MVPELLKSVVGSVVRFALTGVFGYLTAKGVISGMDSELLLTAIAGGAVVLLWSIWQKYKSRLAFLVALGLPTGSTEEDVKTEMRTGGTRGVSAWSLLLLLAISGAVASQSACEKDQQKAIASNVDRIAILIQNTREVRDELFAQGLIDQEDAYKVTLALVKVNTATKAFKVRAEQYKGTGELTPANRDTLRALANDISSAVIELVNNGTFGVKNPDAQAKINAAVGSFRQVVLALLDSINALKPTKASMAAPVPVQRAGFPLAIVPLLLLALRQIVAFVTREKARTGKTAEEIYAEAGVQLDANDAALLEDLAKYGPPKV